MCVIEKKTYIHPGGRQEVVESLRRCHRATDTTLCQHVEKKNLEPFVLNEVKPSYSTQEPREDLVVTNDKIYRKLSRRKNSQSTQKRPNRDSLTPTKAAPSSSSSTQNITPVEFRPSSSQGPRRLSVSYDKAYPPSLSKNQERARSSQQTSTPDQPTVTYRIVRPGKSTVLPGASPASNVSSSPTASPGLSNLPPLSRRTDSASDLTAGMAQSSRSKGKQPARDEAHDVEADRRQEVQARIQARREEDNRRARLEEERQARVMQEALSSTDQRQQMREHQRKQQEAEDRERRRREEKFAAKQREYQLRAEEAAAEAEAEELDRLRRERDNRLAEEDARVRAEQNQRDIAAQRTAEALAHQAAANESARDARRRRLVNAERKQMTAERAGSQLRDSTALATLPTGGGFGSGGGSALASSSSSPQRLPSRDLYSSPLSPRLPHSALDFGASPTSSSAMYSTRTTTTGSGRANVVLHQRNPAAITSSSTAPTAGRRGSMLARGEDFIDSISPRDSARGGSGRNSMMMAEFEDLRIEDERDARAVEAAAAAGGEDDGDYDDYEFANAVADDDGDGDDDNGASARELERRKREDRRRRKERREEDRRRHR